MPDVGIAEILAFCLTVDSLSILRFDGSAKVRREASCGLAAGPHLDLLFEARMALSPLLGVLYDGGTRGFHREVIAPDVMCSFTAAIAACPPEGKLNSPL